MFVSNSNFFIYSTQLFESSCFIFGFFSLLDLNLFEIRIIFISIFYRIIFIYSAIRPTSHQRNSYFFSFELDYFVFSRIHRTNNSIFFFRTVCCQLLSFFNSMCNLNNHQIVDCTKSQRKSNTQFHSKRNNN